jgi:hypothetical protein
MNSPSALPNGETPTGMLRLQNNTALRNAFQGARKRTVHDADSRKKKPRGLNRAAGDRAIGP